MKLRTRMYISIEQMNDSISSSTETKFFVQCFYTISEQRRSGATVVHKTKKKQNNKNTKLRTAIQLIKKS